MNAALILARLDDLTRRLDGMHVSPWLNSAEAAEYLRCSPRKVEELTRRGLLSFSRQDPAKSQSPRLYHRKHLDAYLATGRNPVTHRLSKAEKRKVDELL